VRGIDVHAHFVPAEWLERVAGGEWPGVASLDDGELRCGPASLRLTPRFYDLEAATAGLRLRLLSIPPPLMAYEAPAAAAAAWCRAFNDALLASTAVTDRALPLATLPLQDPEASVDELRRTRALGFPGAQVGAEVNGRSLDAPELRPVLRAAEETRALLLVHPYGPPAQARLRADHYLEPLVAWPVQTTVAAAALLFGGVLEELPGLRAVLAHGGGALPYLLARWDRGYEARPDMRDVLPGPPSVYAGRLLYDSVLFAPQALRFLVEVVGAANVVLGSDHPFPMGLVDPVAAVEAAGLDPEDAELIVERNAAGLLELVC
jgi:aminocarboxymuconate-semialdehyde decarboxylase